MTKSPIRDNTPDGFFKLIDPNGPYTLSNIRIIRETNSGRLLIPKEKAIGRPSSPQKDTKE